MLVVKCKEREKKKKKVLKRPDRRRDEHLHSFRMHGKWNQLGPSSTTLSPINLFQVGSEWLDV